MFDYRKITPSLNDETKEVIRIQRTVNPLHAYANDSVSRVTRNNIKDCNYENA